MSEIPEDDDDSVEAVAAAYRAVPIVTSSPIHAVIGHRFKAWDGNVYLCESEDEDGYWMVQVDKPSERRNVSTRAIGRTFHRVKTEVTP